MSNARLAELHIDLANAYKRLSAIDDRGARLQTAVEEIKRNDAQRELVLKNVGELEAQIEETKSGVAVGPLPRVP